MSTRFYKALLRVSPTIQSATTATFDTASPPVLLVVEQRRKGTGGRRSASPSLGLGLGFTLVVNRPRDVGDAAIALRGAGVRLTLEDSGLAACDPDDNHWQVRFDPSAKEAFIVTAERERPR